MLWREKNWSNFRSKYSLDYLSIKMVCNKKNYELKVVAL
jgi:hypothetical protein